MQDWKDLFRYEPGVSVGANADRFGIGDIRVRGLGGNRVRIQVDGVPVPDAFAIGSYSSAGRAMGKATRQNAPKRVSPKLRAASMRCAGCVMNMALAVMYT